MRKEIEIVIPKPSHFNMVGDGFRVFNYFPGAYSNRYKTDPFLMLDFNPSFYFEPSTKIRGVDVHPHRGFETVTIAYKGAISHHDSFGNKGVIFPGDVQWMTAGSGILHKEYHEGNFSHAGGEFEMVQLWVNLPAKYKMTNPRYQALTSSEIPIYYFPNTAGEMRVISGEYDGIKGLAKTHTPIDLFDINTSKDALINLTCKENYNTCLLVIDGECMINNSEIKKHDFLVFNTQGTEIQINSTHTCKILFLSGQPIQEPIAQHGPFVMNTKEEIIQAFQDYQTGKFGNL